MYQRLDAHSIFPSGMREYIDLYGFHFSKKMCDWAVSNMKDRRGNKITPYSKEQVDNLLNQYNIKLDNNYAYDCVYACNMILADFYGSSISSLEGVAKMIKDFVDDKDNSPTGVFDAFLGKSIGNGCVIIWEDMI